ncbi:MAG: hypothetical protein HC786_23855 [Richelia sp. CSU_2_1]|nr:hypothetical protein [Richelia sp. CSU_2_1]
MAYIALNKRGWDDDGIIWRQATKKEFLDYHDFDDILGSEDDALNSEDSIFCSDGILLGCQILGDD